MKGCVWCDGSDMDCQAGSPPPPPDPHRRCTRTCAFASDEAAAVAAAGQAPLSPPTAGAGSHTAHAQRIPRSNRGCTVGDYISWPNEKS